MVKRILWMVLLVTIGGNVAWAEDYGEPVQEPVHNAPQHDWTFTTSVNYSTGDFGTSTTTDTVYVPFTLQRNFSLGRVYLTIPYIDQRSGTDVNAFGGRPFRTGGPGTGDTGWVGGLGDIILGGSYDLLREPDKPFDLSAFSSIKFPTANKNKRLGTGKFDESLGLTASKDLGKNWSVLGRIGYTFNGEPSGIDLEDQFFYDIGVGYQWTKETFTSITYEEKTKLIDGQSDPRDLILGVEQKLNETVGVFGNLDFGLSNGSPDFSVTVGMNVWF